MTADGPDFAHRRYRRRMWSRRVFAASLVLTTYSYWLGAAPVVPWLVPGGEQPWFDLAVVGHLAVAVAVGLVTAAGAAWAVAQLHRSWWPERADD